MATVRLELPQGDEQIVVKVSGAWLEISRQAVMDQNTSTPFRAPEREPVTGRLDIEHALSEYVAEKTREGLSADYIDEVRRFMLRAIKHGCFVYLTDATEDKCKLFLVSLKKRTRGAKDPKAPQEPCTPKTWNNGLAMFHAFFSWCVKRKKLDADPTSNIEFLIDRRGEQRRAFTPAEFIRLVAAAHTRKRVGARDALIYETGGFTGMRRFEIRGLRVCDLHLDAEEPHITLQPYQYKGGRTAYSAETIPLVCPAYVDRLRAHVKGKPPSAKVFKTMPKTPAIDRDLRVAGIAKTDALGRDVVLHSLRHMLGTTLAVAGVDIRRIQKILRHRDIKTTQKYIDATQIHTAAALREGVALYGDFFRKDCD